jgi:hypothetical protein
LDGDSAWNLLFCFVMLLTTRSISICIKVCLITYCSSPWPQLLVPACCVLTAVTAFPAKLQLLGALRQQEGIWKLNKGTMRVRKMLLCRHAVSSSLDLVLSCTSDGGLFIFLGCFGCSKLKKDYRELGSATVDLSLQLRPP